MMQDIEPGSGSSMESQFFELRGAIIEANGKIFIGASTSAFGNEVWVANAPAEGPLPLELLEFNGTLVNSNAYLQWKTENETNTSMFIVERSLDGNNYYQVGTIVAANMTGINHYSFTDPDITSLGVSIVYYRLRQVDLDGNFDYSDIVALSIENKKLTISLYPNPVSTQINLTIKSNQPKNSNGVLPIISADLLKRVIILLSPGPQCCIRRYWLCKFRVFIICKYSMRTEIQQSIKVLKQ